MLEYQKQDSQQDEILHMRQQHAVRLHDTFPFNNWPNLDLKTDSDFVMYLKSYKIDKDIVALNPKLHTRLKIGKDGTLPGYETKEWDFTSKIAVYIMHEKNQKRRVKLKKLHLQEQVAMTEFRKICHIDL